MKKTKIICTMGPNTDDEEMMRKLVKAGMDVARFNFSHGDHEEQKIRMDLLKKSTKRTEVAYRYITGHQRTGDPYRYSGRRTESISGRRKPVYTDNGTDRGK